MEDPTTKNSYTSQSHAHKKANKGKQSPTAFVLFCRDYRKRICMQCPFLSPPDVSKVLSERWRSLPIVEKEKYKEKAEKAAYMTSEGYFDKKIIHSAHKVSFDEEKRIEIPLLPSIDTFNVPHIFDSLSKYDSEPHVGCLISNAPIVYPPIVSRSQIGDGFI